MTDIDFQQLAQDYGFPDPYELEIEHGKALYLRELPKATEQRDALKEVETHSKPLQEALSALGYSEIKRLRIELGTEYYNADELVKQTMANCELLSAATKSLISELQRLKRPKEPIWDFVLHMADYWYQELGEKPVCYHIPGLNAYNGEFYHFILQCSEYTQRHGSAIRNILKYWELSKKTK